MNVTQIVQRARTAVAVPGRPLRVLVVESSLRENGAVRVCLDYARRWQEAGDAVTLALVQHADDGPTAPPDAALTVCHLSSPGSRARWTAPVALARLVRLARRADVVLVGAEEGNGLLLGWPAARLAGRPLAVLAQADVDVSISTWVPRALQAPTHWIHARTDATVCVGEGVRAGVVAHGLPHHRTSVVPPGIDVAAVRARAAAAAPNPPGPPVVVACGRLAAVKDFALLIRAHARVLAAGVDHRLVVAGQGPDRAALEALVAELGVGATVSLPGYVDDSVVEMGRADLFVLSSRTEGSPLVLFEAMAAGAPVVSTRCAPIVEEILGDGTAGSLVDVGDLEGLAAAMSALLRDPARRRACAARGAELVRTRDAGLSARRVRAVLGDLVRETGGAPAAGPDRELSRPRSSTGPGRPTTAR